MVRHKNHAHAITSDLITARNAQFLSVLAPVTDLRQQVRLAASLDQPAILNVRETIISTIAQLQLHIIVSQLAKVVLFVRQARQKRVLLIALIAHANVEVSLWIVVRQLRYAASFHIFLGGIIPIVAAHRLQCDAARFHIVHSNAVDELLFAVDGIVAMFTGQRLVITIRRRRAKVRVFFHLFGYGSVFVADTTAEHHARPGMRKCEAFIFRCFARCL